MSMRARKADDYEGNKNTVQGKDKDTMNSMFDNRGNKAQTMQQRLY